jgi:predicted transcriptional regulator
MLQAIKEDGAKKTQIMYQANLSYKLLTKYLAETLEACLIRFEDEKGVYVLTPKARFFLEEYEEYSRRNRFLEKQIDDLDEKRRGLEQLCSN